MARLLWTQRQDIGPSPRSKFGLAYDSTRALTYLFGGGPTAPGVIVADSETWAWDGQYWTQVSRFGPERRAGHSMTFDTARGNTLLFGGERAAGDELGDTWVFEGQDWTQVEDIGPRKRTEHAAAYDSDRQRVVLFGGFSDGFVNDTWEWDGATWTQMEATGPRARIGHSMVYDTTRHRTILFGGGFIGDGDAGFSLLNDTWEWDGDSWRMVADHGPSPRGDCALANAGGAVVLHGGATGSAASGETWHWSAGAWSKIQEIGPGSRHAHTMVWDAGRGRLVLFGGRRPAGGDQPAAHFGDTWESPGVPS
jgi:Galactose oxidase, central domain